MRRWAVPAADDEREPAQPPADLPPTVRPQPHPRRLAEWPITVVLTAAGVSLLVVAGGRFRGGTVLLGSAVLLAAALRAVLPARTAGLLVVRSRLLDVLMLAALGTGLVVLALVVPLPAGR